MMLWMSIVVVGGWILMEVVDGSSVFDVGKTGSIIYHIS